MKKPEAYTGSRLAPAITTWSTCHARRARRMVDTCAGVPVGSAAPTTVRLVRIRRADPGVPVPTGLPSASGVLSAAPARRKSMPSTACHSIGCAEPETAKGTVRSTRPAGSRGEASRR